MRNFEYLCPSTVDEACHFLSQRGDEGKVIAGGQSLLVILKQRLLSPACLIDVKGLKELDLIEYSDKDGLRIGATTTHRSVELSPLIRERFRALSDAEYRLASIQVRNWGTIGGNLCHADPKTDLAACMVALKATAVLRREAGTREVAFSEFYKDYYETVLAPDELMTEIRVPPLPPRTGVYYTKFSTRWADAPIVGACVVLTLDGDGETCRDAGIVLAGVGPTPFRANRSEAVLRSKSIESDPMGEAASLASQDCHPVSDVEASEEYKREIVKVLVTDCLKSAWQRAKAT